jgi:enoyl-CoA hydratase
MTKMEYQNLLLAESNGIYRITFNREKALNALNGQTMKELFYLFSDFLPSQSSLKGVILTGSGEKAFVAGADIKEFLSIEAGKGGDMAQNGHNVFSLIENFHVPVLAAINGFALGGGCELAMACHLRIASENARFGQPEINLGIIPGYGGTQRLIQYIGKTKAMQLMLTGDLFSAEDALKWGLLNQVVPANELLSVSEALLGRIAEKAPVAVSAVIASVNAFFNTPGDGFKTEVNQFAKTTQTSDFLEGAQAFIEKRQPKFTGA